MSVNQHFDLTEVLRAFDEASRKAAAVLDADPTVSTSMKRLEISSFAVRRAFTEWMTVARNEGAPSSDLMTMIGGLMANIAFEGSANCHPPHFALHEIMQSFFANLAALTTDDPADDLVPEMVVDQAKSGRA